MLPRPQSGPSLNLFFLMPSFLYLNSFHFIYLPGEQGVEYFFASVWERDCVGVCGYVSFPYFALGLYEEMY